MDSLNQATEDALPSALETATVSAGRAFKPRFIQALLFLAAVAILLYHLGTPSLFEPMETRIASVAASMLETGDLITPRLNGLPVFALPPLSYWASALGQKLVGWGEWGARLTAPLAGGLTVIGCYRIGLILAGPRAALLSAFSLMTCGLFVLMGRFLYPEVFLALWATWMVWSLLKFQRDPKPAWSLCFWSFAALCVLTAGFSGLVPLLALLPLLFTTAPTHRVARQLDFPLGWGLFILFGPGWALFMSANYTGLLSWLTTGYATTALPAGATDGSPLYPLLLLLLGIFPWTMFYLGGLNRAFRDCRKKGGEGYLLLLGWSFILFFFQILFRPFVSIHLELMVPSAIITGIYLARLIHFAQEEPFSFKLESALTLVLLSLIGLSLVIAAIAGYIPDLRLAKVTFFLSMHLLFLSVFGYVSMYMGFSKGMLLVMGVAAPGFMFFLLPGLAGNEECLKATWFPGSREFLERVSKLPSDARFLNVGPMLNGIPFYTGKTVPTWNSDREPSFLASGAPDLDLRGNAALQRMADTGLYLIGRPTEFQVVRDQTHRLLEELFTVSGWSVYRLGEINASEPPPIEARLGSFSLNAFPSDASATGAAQGSSSLKVATASETPSPSIKNGTIPGSGTKPLSPASGAAVASGTKTHGSGAASQTAKPATSKPNADKPSSDKPTPAKASSGKPQPAKSATASGTKPAAPSKPATAAPKPAPKPDAKSSSSTASTSKPAP